MQNTDYDAISRSLFDSFKNGELTRQEYHDEMNNLYGSIPKKIRQNLDFRLDKRSLGQFALQVFDSTQRETFLVNKWRESALEKGIFDQCEISNLGINNDGLILISAAKVNGARRADFMVKLSGKNIPLGEYPLEVKYGPSQRKVTLKNNDLRHYIQQNAIVLIILSNGKMMGANGDPAKESRLDKDSLNGLKFTVLGEDTMRRMLAELEIKARPEYGGKLGVQLFADRFHEYFDLWNF